MPSTLHIGNASSRSHDTAPARTAPSITSFSLSLFPAPTHAHTHTLRHSELLCLLSRPSCYITPALSCLAAVFRPSQRLDSFPMPPISHTSSTWSLSVVARGSPVLKHTVVELTSIVTYCSLARFLTQWHPEISTLHWYSRPTRSPCATAVKWCGGGLLACAGRNGCTWGCRACREAGV
ncbi:hypothetical protein EDB92DRAFT_466079 [Lactarius akahatsu]|uniref:Uncharacterized protein n=1 Tax=Lactarius akahatsu TaxID=416441 RepID=A0AAD4LRU5_9AGAM|nr:hypothetical protein EDB92DRAFT_466079 [Lactarius akahatsu]